MARWITLPDIPSPSYRGFHNYLSSWIDRFSTYRSWRQGNSEWASYHHLPRMANNVWDFDKAVARKHEVSKDQLEPGKALVLDDGNFVAMHGDTMYSSMPTDFAPTMKELPDGNVMIEHDDFILSTVGTDMQSGNNLPASMNDAVTRNQMNAARAITNLSEGNLDIRDVQGLVNYLGWDLYEPIPKFPQAFAMDGFATFPTQGESTSVITPGTELSIPGQMRGGDLRTAIDLLPENAGVVFQLGGDKTNAVLRGKQVVSRHEDLINQETAVSYRPKREDEYMSLRFLDNGLTTDYAPTPVPFAMHPLDLNVWQSKFKITPHSFAPIKEWYDDFMGFDGGRRIGEISARLYKPGPPYLNMRAPRHLVQTMREYSAGKVQQPEDPDFHQHKP